MESYYNTFRGFCLFNPSKQLETPTLVRIDINVPLVNDRIAEDSYRLIVYADILALMSEYAGIVAVAHQGRPGEKDFIPLKQHWVALRKLLPSDIEIEYIPFNKIFTRETVEKIKGLKKKQILLLDNIRMMEEETKFDPLRSQFIKFFKNLIKTCVNDAIPVWHRAHTSLMALPYIAKTYIGIRSQLELKLLDEILRSRERSVALIMGGAKLQKVSYLAEILKWAEGYTGGLPGQLFAYMDGYDLNEQNVNLLKKRFSQEEFEAAKYLLKNYKIRYPEDFVIVEEGEKRVVHITEMCKTKGLIFDIGPATVERYADETSSMEIRIKAGPLGVFERGFDNDIALTKLIAGPGLIFLGGDTTAEITMYKLDRIIANTGGMLCISGGAFLHGLAGEKFPSLTEILKLQK